jgi:hypothetical protein
VLRWLSALCLLLSLLVPTTSLAQEASDTGEPAAAPPAAPTGPALAASDAAPVLCDPGATGFRFVEIRGSGFNAWSSQRLVGSMTDGAGVSRIDWGSVWVSPQGQLTLEVNLCNDPFRNRAALGPGSYTVAVGPGNGAAIAATSIAVTPPPDPNAVDAIAPDAEGAPADGLPAMTPPEPGTGPGSAQQPLRPGGVGQLTDGWRMVIANVDPDAWNAIHSSIPSAQPPAPDQKDVLVSLQAIYTGAGNGVLSGVRLALRGRSGQVYDQLKSSCGVIPGTLPPNLVPPNGGLAGNICFSVPSSDVDGLALFDNQAAEADRVYFALQ